MPLPAARRHRERRRAGAPTGCCPRPRRAPRPPTSMCCWRAQSRPVPSLPAAPPGQTLAPLLRYLGPGGRCRARGSAGQGEAARLRRSALPPPLLTLPLPGQPPPAPPPRLGPAPRRPRGAPRTNGGRGPRPPKAVRRRAPGGRRCPGGSGCGRRAPPRREAALSRAPRPAALQRRPAAATGAEGPPPAGEGAERQRQVPGARRVRRAILPQIPAPAHLALGEIRSSPHNPELRSLSRILTRPCPAAFRTR